MTKKSFDLFACRRLNRFTDLNAMQLVVIIPQPLANAGGRASFLVRFSAGVWHLVSIVCSQVLLPESGLKETTLNENAFRLSGVNLPQSV